MTADAPRQDCPTCGGAGTVTQNPGTCGGCDTCGGLEATEVPCPDCAPEVTDYEETEDDE